MWPYLKRSLSRPEKIHKRNGNDKTGREEPKRTRTETSRKRKNVKQTRYYCSDFPLVSLYLQCFTEKLIGKKNFKQIRAYKKGIDIPVQTTHPILPFWLNPSAVDALVPHPGGRFCPRWLQWQQMSENTRKEEPSDKTGKPDPENGGPDRRRFMENQPNIRCPTLGINNSKTNKENRRTKGSE